MKTSNFISRISSDELSDYDLFCDRLQVVNFCAITQILQQRLSWTKQQIDQAIERYRQLLFLLNQHPDQPIVPDQITDEVLHAHLEMGDRFMQDCLHILGFELIHESTVKMENEGDRHHWLAVFANTQLRLRKNFGVSAKSSTRNRFRCRSLKLQFLLPAYCVLSRSAKYPLSAAPS